MPLKIVRNDITKMNVDAIVNAYLYMMVAGCQGRQAIAVRCIDMS